MCLDDDSAAMKPLPRLFCGGRFDAACCRLGHSLTPVRFAWPPLCRRVRSPMYRQALIASAPGSKCSRVLRVAYPKVIRKMVVYGLFSEFSWSILKGHSLFGTLPHR